MRPAAPAWLNTGNVAYRPAAAGDHQTPLGIGVDHVEPHLVPVRFELIGENTGERGSDMLSHLGADDVDGHHSLAVDAVPDGRLESVGRDLGTRQGPGPGETEGGRSALRHSDEESSATREREDFMP